MNYYILFFAYCETYFNIKIQDLNPNEGKLFQASEVFNNVILTTNLFTELLTSQGETVYPENMELFLTASEEFSKGISVKAFIDYLLNI